ncbi:hypothetical protein PVAP13_3KG372527 [Panicum virgatum]|uniref:Uncharacterized protein n=1 Tax=Panicum virgatum TaxID=38727 RepID=A0A8T0V0V9_PANVG|nr:hypothetical protein PVAP13_3KG372527 [Panicum virgatum]
MFSSQSTMALKSRSAAPSSKCEKKSVSLILFVLPSPRNRRRRQPSPGHRRPARLLPATLRRAPPRRPGATAPLSLSSSPREPPPCLASSPGLGRRRPSAPPRFLARVRPPLSLHDAPPPRPGGAATAVPDATTDGRIRHSRASSSTPPPRSTTCMSGSTRAEAGGDRDGAGGGRGQGPRRTTALEGGAGQIRCRDVGGRIPRRRRGGADDEGREVGSPGGTRWPTGGGGGGRGAEDGDRRRGRRAKGRGRRAGHARFRGGGGGRGGEAVPGRGAGADGDVGRVVRGVFRKKTWTAGLNKKLKGLFAKEPRNGADQPPAMDRTARVGLSHGGGTWQFGEHRLLTGRPPHAG